MTKKTFLARIGNCENGFVSLWTPVVEPIWWHLAQCSNIAKQCYSWQLSSFDMPPATYPFRQYFTRYILCCQGSLQSSHYWCLVHYHHHYISAKIYIFDGNVMLTNLVWKGQSWVDIRNRDVFLKKQEVGRHRLQIFCVYLFLGPSSTKRWTKWRFEKSLKKSKLNSPQHDKKCVFWRHSTIDLAFDNDENITKFNGTGIRVQLNFFRPKYQIFLGQNTLF